MNVLNADRKVAILTALTEGCSVRSVSRMTGSHIETILKLLVDTGHKCQASLDEKMRGLRCEALELDELWCYIQKKQWCLTEQDKIEHPEYGDTYTYIALDPKTKIVPYFFLGKRNILDTDRFIYELSRRIVGSVQLSTDGFRAYISPIQSYFGYRATHASVVKMYASEGAGPGRYSPPKVTGVKIFEEWGIPDRSKVCTSYVERMNLTVRMQMRRFTRLTNAFSRKWENLKAALSLYFWWWNFCWIPRTLRVTPAMAANITERVWTLKEIL